MEQEQFEEYRARLEKQQKSMLRLAGYGMASGRQFSDFTEESARTIGVSKVSVWVLEDGGSKIRCVAHFDLETESHTRGMELYEKDFPSYFSQIKKGLVIDAEDANTDERTSDLREPYLAQQNIGAMLDIPFMKKGKVAGVMCHEHTGSTRLWTSDEKSFAVSVGEMVSLKFEQIERESAEAELKKAKEVAEEATQIKDKFVSLVAHDLKSPFNSILGLLRMLAEDTSPPLDEKHKGLVTRAISSGENLVRMIENVLDITMLQTGKMELDKRFINLASIIEHVRENHGFLAEKKGIKIVDETPRNIRIHADFQMFTSVMQNLLSNAIKFCAKGDTIRITAGKGENILITVKDDGKGISEKMATNLFKHEVKTSTRGTAGEQGTGLGLPYCFDIVSAHGGTMKVKSKPDEGSEFTVMLPAVTPVVLLVEDEKITTTKLREVLAPLDVSVIEAANGQLGLEALENHKVDMIILDILMPVMDGFEFLKRMRRKIDSQSIPVIVLTADKKIDTRDKAFFYGANDFVAKTLVLEEVIPRIKRFIH